MMQYGPVAIYSRNTHVIWRNRAYRIPVIVPWALLITASVIVAPFGIGTLLSRRTDRKVEVT